MVTVALPGAPEATMRWLSMACSVVMGEAGSSAIRFAWVGVGT